MCRGRGGKGLAQRPGVWGGLLPRCAEGGGGWSSDGLGSEGSGLKVRER